ncbi:MAG TPA: heavy metal-associated domain-containing protein [Eubacteriales bacterium]|nr:heavy metal-associated domain-containing protein [Clostridia bacterium]HRV73140.1 heavy metal-associated domain-containing protein [Eubacteriales bacterium]
MTVLKVEGMHCENCVKRIEKALKAEGLKYKLSLADKTVTIDGCEHCVKTALATLDDLGFDAVKQE